MRVIRVGVNGRFIMCNLYCEGVSVFREEIIQWEGHTIVCELCVFVRESLNILENM